MRVGRVFLAQADSRTSGICASAGDCRSKTLQAHRQAALWPQEKSGARRARAPAQHEQCELLPGYLPSAPEVDGSDLLALVPQLPADHQSGLTIMGFLLRGERFAGRPASSRRYPASEFQIPLLRVLVPQTVQLVQPCIGRVTLVDLEVLDIGAVGRDERAPARQPVRPVEYLPLLCRPDGDLARLPPFRPGILQHHSVAAVGIHGLEFDRFLTPQAKGALQLQAHPDVRIPHPGQGLRVEGPGFGKIGHILSVRDAVMGVVVCQYPGSPYFLSPPAEGRQPVLDSAGREALALPLFDQGIDVTSLQFCGMELLVAQRIELIGHQAENPGAVRLIGIAPVPVTDTELLELVVEITHGSPLPPHGWRRYSCMVSHERSQW